MVKIAFAFFPSDCSGHRVEKCVVVKHLTLLSEGGNGNIEYNTIGKRPYRNFSVSTDLCTFWFSSAIESHYCRHIYGEIYAIADRLQFYLMKICYEDSEHDR